MRHIHERKRGAMYRLRRKARQCMPLLRKNSRRSVRWSAVPVAPKLVYGRGGGERGSGPEGADDLCWARI